MGISPPLVGSGKLGTPWERMQREKATARFCRPDAVEALEEVLVWIAVESIFGTWLVGEPPQAAASRATPAAAAQPASRMPLPVMVAACFPNAIAQNGSVLAGNGVEQVRAPAGLGVHLLRIRVDPAVEVEDRLPIALGASDRASCAPRGSAGSGQNRACRSASAAPGCCSAGAGVRRQSGPPEPVSWRPRVAAR